MAFGRGDRRAEGLALLFIPLRHLGEGVADPLGVAELANEVGDGLLVGAVLRSVVRLVQLGVLPEGGEGAGEQAGQHELGHRYLSTYSVPEIPVYTRILTERATFSVIVTTMKQ